MPDTTEIPELRRLERELADAHEEIAQLREKLEPCANLMAWLGMIHNTPYAKRKWMED